MFIFSQKNSWEFKWTASIRKEPIRNAEKQKYVFKAENKSKSIVTKYVLL